MEGLLYEPEKLFTGSDKKTEDHRSLREYLRPMGGLDCKLAQTKKETEVSVQ